MLHYLALGHFDLDALKAGPVRAWKPLDMALVRRLLSEYGNVDAQGGYTLGGYKVELNTDFVSCPWLMPRKVMETEQFARRLVAESGCMVIEAKAREIVSLTSLLPS